MIFAAMVSFLTACRIITIQQATAGFASSGLLTVVVLYVVAEGISQTGGDDPVFSNKRLSPPG